jgi:hypothetical protein
MGILSYFIDFNQIALYALTIIAAIFGVIYMIVKKAIIPSDIISSASSFFSKPIVYVFVLLGVIILGLYYVNAKDIKNIALMEYNREQLEQNIKDQQELIKQQQAINEDQRLITKQLVEQNQKLSTKITSINNFLNSDAAKKSDRPSSDVLKKTVEMLKSGNIK